MAKVTSTKYGELAMLPYPAETPVSESWAFLTDIQTAQNGLETRQQLRGRPRVSLAYKVPVKPHLMAETFNIAYGAIRSQWAIPLWTESQPLKGAIPNGTTVVACNTSFYDFRGEGGLALLYVSPAMWKIVEIAEVNETGLVIAATAGGTITDAVLMPVRVGYITGTIGRETNGFNAKLSMVFEVKDNPTVYETTEEPTLYLGTEVITEAPLRGGSADTRTIEMATEIADQELGDVFTRTTWTNARYATPVRKMLKNSQSVRDYKAFLFRRRGKLSAYWAPLFEQSMRLLSSGNIGNAMQVVSDSYKTYGSQRKHIAVLLKNKTWLFREISASTQVTSSSVQLTFTQALNIKASDIVLITYLGLNRLDSDTVELQWVGNNVATVSLRAIEITP